MIWLINYYINKKILLFKPSSKITKVNNLLDTIFIKFKLQILNCKINNYAKGLPYTEICQLKKKKKKLLLMMSNKIIEGISNSN